jgi:2-hydroxy-3-keto-5-methylthiopentenyl-1-phosphate phosphatase
VLGESHEDDVIVYIGDGRSDTCAVQHADVVFAKDYLAAWCTEQRIPHHPYRTLSDVQRILASKLATGALRQRRQAVLARKAAYLEE